MKEYIQHASKKTQSQKLSKSLQFFLVEKQRVQPTPEILSYSVFKKTLQKFSPLKFSRHAPVFSIDTLFMFDIDEY